MASKKLCDIVVWKLRKILFYKFKLQTGVNDYQRFLKSQKMFRFAEISLLLWQVEFTLLINYSLHLQVKNLWAVPGYFGKELSLEGLFRSVILVEQTARRSVQHPAKKLTAHYQLIIDTTWTLLLTLSCINFRFQSLKSTTHARHRNNQNMSSVHVENSLVKTPT